MDQLVKCDICGKTYSLSNVKLQEKYLGAMLTEVFFNAPCCNYKVFCCIKNSKCRNLIKKIDNIRNSFDEKFSGKHRSKHQIKKLEILQKELKIEMDKINGR